MKKRVIVVASLLLILLIFLGFSTPTESQFEQWIEENYNISCDKVGNCQYNDKQLYFKTSRKKDVFIYVTYERTYIDENGERYILRLLGIANNIIAIEEVEL